MELEREVLVDDGGKSEGEALPLVVRPATTRNESSEFLRSWVSKNKEWLDQKLLQHGKNNCASLRILILFIN